MHVYDGDYSKCTYTRGFLGVFDRTFEIAVIQPSKTDRPLEWCHANIASELLAFNIEHFQSISS